MSKTKRNRKKNRGELGPINIKYKSMMKDKSKSRCLPIMTGTRRTREVSRRGKTWYLTSVPSIFDRCRPHTESKVRLG